MGKDNIIEVGRSEHTKFVALGDDSQFGDVLAYAYVILDRDGLNMVRDDLVALRKQFKIPVDTSLHCRVLFSGQQREKAGIGHLREKDVKALVRQAVDAMNNSKILLRYAIGHLSRWQEMLGTELEFNDDSGVQAEIFTVKTDPKGILSLLSQACFAVPSDGSKGPTARECQIFASKDATKVRFIGKGRKRADGMYNGFLDIGAPEGQVYRQNPVLIDASAEPLLQIADIAAYLCSHAQDHLGRNAFFRKQLNRIKLRSVARMAPTSMR